MSRHALAGFGEEPEAQGANSFTVPGKMPGTAGRR